MLIGQADKNLLIVLHERDSNDPDQSNYILIEVGPIACNVRALAVAKGSAGLNVDLNTDCDCAEQCCTKFRNEIADLKQLRLKADLKQSLLELNLDDQTVKPYRNDEIAKQLMKNDIKLIDKY